MFKITSIIKEIRSIKMRKFKFKDREFEMDYVNDIAPVVLAKEYGGNKVDIEKLKEDFKDVKIFSYTTHSYDEESCVFYETTFYYTGAKAVEYKRYKSIDVYSYDMPPENIIIESVLQVGRYKKRIYTTIKNHNCTMIDLIDSVVEDVLKKYKDEHENDYIMLDLYDDGGWLLDFEINANYDSVKELITSIRMVEEV